MAADGFRLLADPAVSLPDREKFADCGPSVGACLFLDSLENPNAKACQLAGRSDQTAVGKEPLQRHRISKVMRLQTGLESPINVCNVIIDKEYLLRARFMEL